MTRAVGLGVTAFAAAVGVAILAAAGFAPRFLALLASDAVVLALGAVAVVAGLGALYRTYSDGRSDGAEAGATALATPLGSDRTQPDDGDEDRRWNELGAVIAGRSWEGNHDYVDETFRRALERPDVGIGTRTDADRAYYRREARSAVVETAVTVLARRHDVDEADAAATIRDGGWTDDPRAAAFLEGSVRLPLRTRFVDWLYGVRYRRGLEAAVREVERLAAGGALERDRDESTPSPPASDDAPGDDPAVDADDYGSEAWLEATEGAPFDAAVESAGNGTADSEPPSESRPTETVADADVAIPDRSLEGTEISGGDRR